MVDSVGTDNFGQYTQVQRDLGGSKRVAQKVNDIDVKLEKALVGTFIPGRRVISVEDKMKKGDNLAAAGALGVGVITLKEDLRDVKAGIEQADDILHGRKYKGKYDFTKFQHDFSLLKGSLFEDWYKNTKNKTVKKVLEYLYDKDESIYEISFGKKIRKFLGLTNGEGVKTGLKDRFGGIMRVSEIKAPNSFAELTGRATKRTTVLGLIVLGLLELPKIIKATDKGNNILEQTENTAKQTAKAGINVASIAAGIGYGGAIGAKKFGAIGSLLGMSVGAVAGATASEKFQGFMA